MFLAGSTQDARDCCDGRVCAGAWRQKPRIVSGNELLPLRLRADMRRRGMERVRKGGGGAACLAMVSVTLPAAKRRLRCCRRRGAVCADAFAMRFSAQMFHVKHLFLYRTTLRQCVSRETYAGEAVRQGFDDRSGDCLAAARSRRLRPDRDPTVVDGAGRFARSFRGARQVVRGAGAQANTRRGNA